MAVAPLPHRGTAATTAVEGWVVSRRVLGPSLSFVTLASRADACSCCARARAARQLELTDIVFDRGVFRGDPDGAECSIGRCVVEKCRLGLVPPSRSVLNCAFLVIKLRVLGWWQPLSGNPLWQTNEQRLCVRYFHL